MGIPVGALQAHFNAADAKQSGTWIALLSFAGVDTSPPASVRRYGIFQSSTCSSLDEKDPSRLGLNFGSNHLILVDFQTMRELLSKLLL